MLYVIDHADPAHPKVLLGDKTKFLRQYYKFVRPGATRIEAASQVGTFDPLAFINADGGYVVVVKCDAGGDFSLGGLAAGTYGIKYTTAGGVRHRSPGPDHRSGPTHPHGDSAGRRAHGIRPADDVRPGAPFRPGGPRRERSDHQRAVIVTWSASTDNIAVAGYRIYRDGTQVGFSPTTSFEDTKVEAGASYVYEVRAYDTAGNESPLSAALTVVMPQSNIGSDVLGYWKFDEGQGGTAVDSSGYVITGPSSAQPGHRATSDRRWISTGPMTTSRSSRRRSSTTWKLSRSRPGFIPAWTPTGTSSTKATATSVCIAEGNNRSLDGRVRYEGAHAYSKSLNNTVRLNEWQHVALVWSRATDTTRLYHNGVEVRYAIQDIGTGSPLDDTTHPWTIGARGTLGSVTFFNGLIDEVRLYRRALAGSEIGALYGSPAVRQ